MNSVIIKNDKIIVANKVEQADSFIKRLKGLMGKPGLAPGEGLLLKNCSSIHCFFMKFPIDVVYLSADMKVLAVETIYPWRLGSFVKGAKHVLELPIGAAGNLALGEIIRIEELEFI